MFPSFALLTSFITAVASIAQALNLTIGSTGVNKSSDLLYGILYEDIYHSGDGGMYGELIRNRAFQGSPGASTIRNTGFWHSFGGASLIIDQSSPALSSALPYQMRMDVPQNTTGNVGFYNEGFWGFNVDAAKRYVASLYMRGTYSGQVECYFQSNTTGSKLSSVNLTINQNSTDGWIQTYSPTFNPATTVSYPNNTFYFSFNGTALAGQSVYLNLLSLFKQTYKDRVNGLREDLATVVATLNAKYLRMPGGNNMEGIGSPYYWKWYQTIGDLKNRPGRPGTWGDVDTTGLGLIEQLQWAQDMNQTVLLAVWAGLYLDGEVVAQSDFQPYVDEIMNELEFLLGPSSTTYGAQRASLGYPNPFLIRYVEIGNEDYLNNGTDSYYSYRYNMIYSAIKAQYPSITIVSTTNPSPNTSNGNAVDLHIYGNEAYFVSLFNNFDQTNRTYPVFVGEYAATQTDSNTNGQVGAQTFGMSCAEAIFLLGCERNSDVVVGTSYGALIKEYNEAPDTVAVIKHTANEILHTMSYYVQKLFADHKGSQTLQVTASDGGYGPVYWSATKSGGSSILKLVNYNGTTGSSNAVSVTVQGSRAASATLITLSAPLKSSVNNLPVLGGEVSMIVTKKISGSGGIFSVPFSSAYEIAVLVV